jgi:hypothetical protein
MKKLALVAGIFLLSACGYDGRYRYSCQDPENWEAPECNPPLCNVDGNCTEALLGFNPLLQDLIPTTIPEETVTP